MYSALLRFQQGATARISPSFAVVQRCFAPRSESFGLLAFISADGRSKKSDRAVLYTEYNSSFILIPGPACLFIYA